MLSLTKFSYIKEILSRSLKDGDDPNPWSRPACGCSVETRNVTGEGRRREKRNKAYESGCFVQHPAARTLFWTSSEEPPYVRVRESCSPLFFLLYRFLRAATAPPCPSASSLALTRRRRDEMKPSISVIAAARRFLALAEALARLGSGKRSAILSTTPPTRGLSSLLRGYLSLPYARGC